MYCIKNKRVSINIPTTLSIALFYLKFLIYKPHTYIIGHYNPSVKIIDLVFPLLMLCVNFIHKWQDLQFKVYSEQQIFWETFHGNFIYSQSFCQKSADSFRRRNTFCILLWCLTWVSNPEFTSNKPTHYLLDYGDFIHLQGSHMWTMLKSEYQIQFVCIRVILLYSFI